MAEATEAEIIAEMHRMGWSDLKDATIDAWQSYRGKWPKDQPTLHLPLRWKTSRMECMGSQAIVPSILVVISREVGFYNGERATRIVANLRGTRLQTVLDIRKD